VHISKVSFLFQSPSYLIREDNGEILGRKEAAYRLVESHDVTSERHYEKDRQKIVEMIVAQYGVDWPELKELPILVRNKIILAVRNKSQLKLKEIYRWFTYETYLADGESQDKAKQG
jgi:hypothetical protein